MRPAIPEKDGTNGWIARRRERFSGGDACRHPRGGRTHQGCRRTHAEPLVPHSLQAARLRHLPEIRESAVHLIVQGTRRAQQAPLAAGRGAQARCCRHVGRQSRARRRLSRRASWNPHDDRDAGRHALQQGEVHEELRGARDSRWRNAGAGVRACAEGCTGRGPRFHPSL